jgi:hypothetical protein
LRENYDGIVTLPKLTQSANDTKSKIASVKSNSEKAAPAKAKRQGVKSGGPGRSNRGGK